MTNKPRNLYDVLNDFGHWFGESPIPSIEQVQRPVSIDLSQFTKEQLQWMKEAEENGND